MAKTISPKMRQRIIIAEFALPAVIILAVLVFFPIVKTVIMSFQEWQLTSPSADHPFLGLENYKDVISLSHFSQMVGTTLIYTFFSVAGKMLIGLLVALLFNRPFKGRAVARGLMLIPWAMPTVVACNVFLISLDPNYGILTAFIEAVCRVTGLDVFSSTTSSLVAVILIGIWKNFPFISLMLLAALSGIPQDYYDAASIDGANAFVKFRSVTWPQIKPIWNTLLVLQFLWTVKEFELIYLITRGGPNNATNVMGIDIYLNAFRYYHVGVASAEGVILLLICIVFSLIYFRGLNKEEQA